TGINTSPRQDRIRGKKDAEAAGLVPAKIRERGTLRIGGSADAAPPLGFYATDDKTRIGVETDLAVLVADTLGLKPQFEEVSWENLFVGLDSGKFDAVFSNVTVTEERKEKYDFATYRLDDIAVIALQ
ncbi:ABC transporter substrate-binding protein, partial [Streptomyces sp. NRRL F-6602]